ncbi:class I SAM-dependent methyltransferase [Nanoarchaeota archaeon]
MNNPVQIFYNNPYFENLQITPPFLEYLHREESQLRKSVIGGLAIDIGCGNGRSTAMIPEIADLVIGIDFSERLLDQAKTSFIGRHDMQFYLQDARSTSFGSDSFDYVIMLWNTFGDLYSGRERALHEARRIVKQQGKILLSVLSDGVLQAYLELLEINKLVCEHHDENYVFLREGLVSERFSQDKLEGIFQATDLKYNIKPLTDISYWCEAYKEE